MKRLLYTLFLFLISLYTHASLSIEYTPQIKNYSVNDYKAGNQNWAVGQDKDGYVYFGNNRGLTVFDGIRWKLYTLPNNISIRSLYTGRDGRIYIGSFEEFGYFEKDKENGFTYHSLKSRVLDYPYDNEEIWTIHEYEDKILFQSFSSWYVFDGENVERHKWEYPLLYFFTLKDRLFVQFMNGDFSEYKKGELTTLFSRESVRNDDVVGVLAKDGQILIVTASNGLYLYDEEKPVHWDIPAGKALAASTANRAVSLGDSIYIIGTISDGLYAINKEGRQLWHINRENNLINNTVLGLHIDTNGNLWSALDNGVAFIQTQSPIYLYEPFEAQIGMVHDMAFKDGNIYLATNQGIYVQTPKDENPRLIAGTNEQTWYITVIDNQIIAGHNRGTLSIEGDKAYRIEGPNGGGTAIRKCILHGKEVLLQASYTSMSVFSKDNSGKWQFSHNINGFNNLIKSLEIDHAGNIWAGHMFKGIYRLRLDETLQNAIEVEHITRLNNKAEEGIINVMKLRGRILLTDGNLFYTYEDLTGEIVPYPGLSNEYPEMADTYRIIAINNDLYWFIRNSEYLLFNYESGQFTLKEQIPFSLFENPSIEDRGNVYIDEEGQSYFCLNGGFAFYSSAYSLMDKQKKAYPLAVNTAFAYNRYNSEYYYLPPSEDSNTSSEEVTLPYKYNYLTFEIAYPSFSTYPYPVSYKLEGFDTDWTENSYFFTQTYSNLPPGNYTFRAILKDTSGKTVSSITYPFKIETPFYKTSLAWSLYFLLTIGVLSGGIWAFTGWSIRKETQELEKQQKEQEEQLREQEQIIIRLKNEKLVNDLNFKSKELASATLSVITYNDILKNIKKEIQSQMISGNYTKRFFEKLIRMIDDNITNEEEWNVFMANFDRIHENFFYKLKQRYPELTPGDLRMCALLRLNMPTKDMARMQNLSIRGIEAARYRLRKKLNLPEGESLVDFMINFH